tara:strand:- start:329 stop:604 length:276 start_codon:yes stop_codon:yes gene_type:complete
MYKYGLLTGTFKLRIPGYAWTSALDVHASVSDIKSAVETTILPLRAQIEITRSHSYGGYKYTMAVAEPESRLGQLELDVTGMTAADRCVKS